MSNTITITGNLTREPELKFMNSGQALVRLGVAVTRKFKDEEQTSFFDVTAWGSLAENVANSLHKGIRVTVTGRLEQRSWDDKDGNKKYAIEIVAEDIAASLRFNSVDVQNGAHGGQIAKPKTAAYPAHEDAF